MTDASQSAEAEIDPGKTIYDELPDAPPKKQIKLSWTGKIGVAIVAFWVIMVIIGPWVAPFHEAEIMADDSYLPPGSVTDGEGTHWLGSDYLERDILSRIIWGARMTVGISFIATVAAYLIGVTAGIAAAVKKGWIDMSLSRVNDAILSLPTIMLGLLIVVALGSSIPILIGTAAIIYASSVFRIARALGQDIMVMDYVESAQARGESIWWIIFKEVLPNAVMPLATDFGLRLVFVVLFISSLSFLGLGIQPPAADWGSMVRQNLEGLQYGALAPVWPALAIASFTIAVNLIVDDVSAKSGGDLAKKMI
ncbi:MAG: ABC transporter permease [Rhodobacteraceae bacterium]|nr:ABC transporter permease [Paracoccaceae bacterium]